MSTSFEQLVRAVRATTSMFSPQFTPEQLGEGLHDAVVRLEAVEQDKTAIAHLQSLIDDLAKRIPPAPPAPAPT